MRSDYVTESPEYIFHAFPPHPMKRFPNLYFMCCIWALSFHAASALTLVMKTEYQGRGTPHWHIAAWVVCFGILQRLKGRSGTAVVSAFVKLLEALFHCQIDVQIGNGRLNYINGYVSKDHDAVDVGLGEYVRSNSTAPWLATYRLLSKSSPCIPEVAIRMASLSEFEKSYSHVLLYPPQPIAVLDFDQRKSNFSSRMYGSRHCTSCFVLKHISRTTCIMHCTCSSSRFSWSLICVPPQVTPSPWGEHVQLWKSRTFFHQSPLCPRFGTVVTSKSICMRPRLLETCFSVVVCWSYHYMCGLI